MEMKRKRRDVTNEEKKITLQDGRQVSKSKDAKDYLKSSAAANLESHLQQSHLDDKLENSSALEDEASLASEEDSMKSQRSLQSEFIELLSLEMELMEKIHSNKVTVSPPTSSLSKSEGESSVHMSEGYPSRRKKRSTQVTDPVVMVGSANWTPEFRAIMEKYYAYKMKNGYGTNAARWG